MKYYINVMERTIDLDDELVNVYIQYYDLCDDLFVTGIFPHFHKLPSKEDVPDDELSKICNEVLYFELKTMCLLPKINAIMNKKNHPYNVACKNGELFEYIIKDKT